MVHKKDSRGKVMHVALKKSKRLQDNRQGKC